MRPMLTRTCRISALIRFCGLVLAAVLIVGTVHAEPPDAPPFYAIRDVTVVSGAGAPIEGATVLLADGLIEAVGTGIEIPADAWVIDGEGLTLYPGLVDSLTTLRQKQEEDGGGPGGRRWPRRPPGAAAEPRRSAARKIGQRRHRGSPQPIRSVEDGRVEKWRKAGFTATVT